MPTYLEIGRYPLGQTGYTQPGQVLLPGSGYAQLGRTGPTSHVSHPFGWEIQTAAFPPGYKGLGKVDKYDGTTDPTAHWMQCMSVMDAANLSDANRCMTFHLTLKDQAINWYCTLPRNS
ncbi:hypothetical protein, partial [Salmonella enterica]|uniref:hypothetical protein n=1 Tax=Salmonella enterica TaxID=28901 RepID=UPI001F19FFF2